MEELSSVFGSSFKDLGLSGFVDDNTFLIGVGDNTIEHNYYFSWDILEKRVKNYVNFNYNQSIDVNDTIILVYGYYGVIGYLNKNIVPVKDNEIENIYLSYRNNQLEYYSDKSFLGQLIIYDTTGKMIANLGSQPFVIGKNTIRINQPLPIGIYILTIKNGTEQNSYKFIVE